MDCNGLQWLVMDCNSLHAWIAMACNGWHRKLPPTRTYTTHRLHPTLADRTCHRTAAMGRWGVGGLPRS
eukprot:13512489-Alexandrium_andersonii.AAC.1